MSNVKSWKALLLLSVVVPVGLLATFRLTGVLHEPLTPETITAEAVNWNISRPIQTATIDRWVKSSFFNGIASLNFSVHVAGYREDWPIWPSDGDDDIVDLRISVNANISEGYIHSIKVRFSETDLYAYLDIMNNPDSIELNNLTRTEIRDGSYLHEALFNTVAGNEVKQCLLKITVFWVFLDQNNVNHDEVLRLETTFFDGAVYRKVVLPIHLEVLVP